MRTLYLNRCKETIKHNTAVKVIMAVTAIMFGIFGALRIKAAVAKHALASRSGEGYVDTAIKILIAVVLGALILAGLYLLFNSTVLPTLTQRITDMFNYKP